MENFKKLPQAALTNAELADQLHEMRSCGGPFMYPNPVDTTLREKKLPYVESKTVLVIMDSNLGADPEYLNPLENKDTIEYVQMYSAFCDDEDSPFDMGKFSDWAAQNLPKLHYLNVMHTPIQNFRLESTTLKNLVLTDPQISDESWDIKCPNLVDLSLENHTPPVKKFQQALINCPRIETYFSHKYWNEEPLPALYLPNCTSFTFRRGDCTASLKLYLPKVEELNLDACYDLRNVQLLKRGHPDHKEWNLARGATPSKFYLSLTNANLSNRVKKALLDTDRVLNPSVFDGEGEGQGCSIS